MDDSATMFGRVDFAAKTLNSSFVVAMVFRNPWHAQSMWARGKVVLVVQVACVEAYVVGSLCLEHAASHARCSQAREEYWLRAPQFFAFV